MTVLGVMDLSTGVRWNFTYAVAPERAEVRRMAAQPDYLAKMRDLGYEPGGSTQAQFTAQVRPDYTRWGGLIKRAGVKLE